ncbi:MAG: purine-nucleoside phosphorylase [Ruminococcaceae bacterium]|nr:purine-nucleoside phosphorylase [Oscillospiraceae bacterium]
MKNTAQIQLLHEIGFAKTVLMPGDPHRAKMIAETFLDNAVLVNNIREAQGYTGYYKGHKVSVMASGMGMPSMGLYAYELFQFFGVENIVRVGTAGSLQDDIKLRDVVAASRAETDSNFGQRFAVDAVGVPACASELLSRALLSAKELGIDLKVGDFYTTDLFYDPDPDVIKKWSVAGSLAVEMETAGLYLTALRCKKRALAICTISNLPLLPDDPGCTPEERELTFTDMIKIALDVAIKI